MYLYHSRVACWLVIVGMLATIGCDAPSGSGGSDMEAMANRMLQGQREAEEAAAAQARAEAEAREKAAKEAARAEAAAAAAAAEAAAKQAAQQAQQQDNETTITITVKNPQGLMNNPEAQAEAERLTAGGGTINRDGSYFDAIIGANRSIRTRADDLAWTQAVRSYWAEKGHYPRNHEEFMTGVIEAYGIQLEPLEEGQEYLYVPGEGDFGALFILEPRQPPATEAAPQ